MNILFVCTAHNSLSQRLYLALSKQPAVTITIEYAISDGVIREAARLTRPDLIICPFLTSRVPKDIYENYLTLIIHPGPPGDAGPSSLDWVLMGDDGSEPDPAQLLQRYTLSEKGRSHWAVTVLQAEDEFDTGPVWAFEQFPIDIDETNLTKSSLYRGPVTRAAVSACLAAVDRIKAAARTSSPLTPPSSPRADSRIGPLRDAIHPGLVASPQYRELCAGLSKPFMGGSTHHRPLLKAGQRDFDVNIHGAKEISRRIRCADSQPGCLSSVLGHSLYLYGGIVEEGSWCSETQTTPGSIVAVRDEAVCIRAADNMGVWITHIRRVKKKTDVQLWPKIPAVSGLRELGFLTDETVTQLSQPLATEDWTRAPHETYQDIWVDFTKVYINRTSSLNRVAYVYSDFYNGAMSTHQCIKLMAALEFVLSTHTADSPLAAVVMMGGAGYFSNGIHLNVIEAAADPALESWNNINRINDIVYYLLHEFPSRGILTVAGIRGNAAAGGVAMATACDCVVAGAEVVLNPAYAAIGLYGSEYHSISYTARCGLEGSRRILSDMTPISAHDARSIRLVDHVLPGTGALLDTRIRNHVNAVVRSAGRYRNGSASYHAGWWKWRADISPLGLARARAMELGEMAQDFWGARSATYHGRRAAFVRKMKAVSTPLQFAKHRRDGHSADEKKKDCHSVLAREFGRKLEQGSSDEYMADVLMDDAPVIKMEGPIFACYYDT
ncbi:ClpP/crotonase [Cryphonectria parasitica EP155]|uniref:ClpP/crotonase n=1 Tax=Cryphonectria parasitica (strain ATCC 38755 / EP155) TaxID=660469 RepID=A0A9P4YB10_CRYP1|nr:ClpP/crotonase [Cryphonectria parasitica EP155]KAF3769720.1 ClpP/crotonase [Cryphonectria parasitica EP155]